MNLQKNSEKQREQQHTAEAKPMHIDAKYSAQNEQKLNQNKEWIVRG